MAKTRMLKTDQRRSIKVASWPIEVRYFWVLLWGYADDHGKAVDNAMLIKSDCFPLDKDITEEMVESWMDILHRAGVITRYEVKGSFYFAIVNWKEHQKPPHPTADTIPGPEVDGACARAVHAERAATEQKSPLGLGWAGSGDGMGSSGGAAPSATTAPPLFCSSHSNGTEGKCGPCGDARRRYDAWMRARKAAEAAPAVAAPPRHIPGLCDAHRQREGQCEMCELEANERVIHGNFGRIA